VVVVDAHGANVAGCVLVGQAHSGAGVEAIGGAGVRN